MASTTNDLRLFGLDLRALWSELCSPWRGRSGAVLTDWLTPTVAIRFTRHNADVSFWQSGPIPRPARRDVRSARFDAVDIPEDVVLRRELNLPLLSEDQTAAAVAMEVRSISPFAPDDLVWGYRARDGLAERRKVEIALASRKQVEQSLQAHAGVLRAGQQPEVWVMVGEDSTVPMVINGFGETLRQLHQRRLRRVCIALAGLAIGLCVAIAVTPSAQLWMRSVQARAEMDQLKRRVAPVVSERDAFVQSTNRLNTLSELLSARVDPLRVMDAITKVLPDDTSVQILQVQGSKVTINGLTVSAAALMQELSHQPGLRDVKAPSGATRPQGAQRENYVIEFTLVEPKPKPVEATDDKAATSAAAASAASVASSPASAAAPAPASSAPSPAPAASTVSAGSAPMAGKPASAPLTPPAAIAPRPAAPAAPAAASPFAVGGSRTGAQGGKP